jgi:glycine/D-amino acid oxidase-like deaminating enzyme/nitrite reductase/ring-hydroxylating ferredoxin subunit
MEECLSSEMRQWNVFSGRELAKRIKEPLMSYSRADSYWNATASSSNFPKLSEPLHVDVAIVGGGIVGITTARMLKDKGLTVAVVEARKVGRQVTGKSTAKVTTQHSLRYKTLKSKFGEERAQLYAEAQEVGIREIERLIREYQIDCDFETKAAFVYTCQENLISELEKELEVAKSLGLPASLVEETGLPFQVEAALRFDGQAQFHPTKYVSSLAETIPGEGCHVFEQSRVTDWTPNHIETEHGSVSARNVVMATHLPLGQVGFYYAEVSPYAEPVIAAPIGRTADGMYLSVEEPTHSFRTHTRGDTVFGVATGPSFKPGDTKKQQECFGEIERWLTSTFDAGPVQYRWVNEDYGSMDSMPFIGWSSSSNDRYLVATGFGAWGISNGTAAGIILADLAVGLENRWVKAFDATRIKPIAGGPKFIAENLGVASHLIGGYLSRYPKSFDALALGEAAIVQIDGKNLAAFRDEKGKIHAVSAVCSHMGCLVGWNENDRTWDCSCHGSRFGLDGDVLHGPATRPLGFEITG